MSDLLDVAAARAELGMSQAQFADLLGVDQSSVSLWETGKTEPRQPVIRLIERILEEKRREAAA